MIIRCPDCEYARLERAGMYLENCGGISHASVEQADAFAAGERCAEHRERRELRISVHNRATERLTGDFEYVGRGKNEKPGAPGRRLGNPFVIGPDGSREDVVRKFKLKLWGHIKLQDEVFDKLAELLEKARTEEGLRLVCHCVPLPCHAVEIAHALVYMDKQRMA